jgi:hypothetical protein
MTSISLIYSTFKFIVLWPKRSTDFCKNAVGHRAGSGSARFATAQKLSAMGHSAESALNRIRIISHVYSQALYPRVRGVDPRSGGRGSMFTWLCIHVTWSCICVHVVMHLHTYVCVSTCMWPQSPHARAYVFMRLCIHLHAVVYRLNDKVYNSKV